jgi:hypothetical protein
VFVPEHAGRCLTPTHDRCAELRDECPILALDPFAAFDGLNGDGIGIDAKANPANCWRLKVGARS